MNYQLFAASHVYASLQQLEAKDQDLVLTCFESLAMNPFQGSDYPSDVQYAGPNEVVIVGDYAVVYTGASKNAGLR